MMMADQASNRNLGYAGTHMHLRILFDLRLKGIPNLFAYSSVDKFSNKDVRTNSETWDKREVPSGIFQNEMEIL